MRKQLRDLGDKDRHTFTAEFVRFGIKNGYAGDVPTILFKEVRLGEKIVCDHIWFTCGKQFDALNLQHGDIVEFSARVSSYIKGYMGRRDDVWDKPIEQDWRLSFPTKARKIGHNDNAAPPAFSPRQCSATADFSIPHSERVARALAHLRLAPPKWNAVFIDENGSQIGEADSEKRICERIGCDDGQWNCFFRGMVGRLPNGESISLRFVKRTLNAQVPPYYRYGAIIERRRRGGNIVREGYGFPMAAYVLGWKEFPPLYVATHCVALHGKENAKGEIVRFLPLGKIAEWEMSIREPLKWADRLKEKIAKITEDNKGTKGE